MKAISNNIALLYLAGMLAACLAVPLLLWRSVGPLAGALSAGAAAALWWSQYRLPARDQRRGAYFWFVISGYGLIGVSLLASLARLLL